MSLDTWQIHSALDTYLAPLVAAAGGSFSIAKTQNHALELLSVQPGAFRVVLTWANTAQTGRGRPLHRSRFSLFIQHHPGFSLRAGSGIAGDDADLLNLHTWLHQQIHAAFFSDGANCPHFELENSIPIFFEATSDAPAFDAVRLDYTIDHLPALPDTAVEIGAGETLDAWQIHSALDGYLTPLVAAAGGKFSIAKTQNHALELLAGQPAGFRCVLTWSGTAQPGGAMQRSNLSLFIQHHPGLAIRPGASLAASVNSLLGIHAWLSFQMQAAVFDNSPRGCSHFLLENSIPLFFDDSAGERAPAFDVIRLDFSIDHIPALPVLPIDLSAEPDPDAPVGIGGVPIAIGGITIKA